MLFLPIRPKVNWRHKWITVEYRNESHVCRLYQPCTDVKFEINRGGQTMKAYAWQDDDLPEVGWKRFTETELLQIKNQ